MKKRILPWILCLLLCLAAVPSAFAASEESTVTVSLTQLTPGYYLCAVWNEDELLTMFDHTVGSDGKLEAVVGVGKVFPQGKELKVGISSANAGGTFIPPITCKVGSDTSSTPSQPTTPAEPDKPGYYWIYSPYNVTGGSVSVSHSYALPGTTVYIDVYEHADFALRELYAVDGRGNSVRLTKHDRDEYSFSMPSSSVDIYVDFERLYYSSYSSGTVIAPANVSVPQQKTGAAQWRYSNGLIYESVGVVASGTPFSRDMLLSVLFNADGQQAENPTFWAADTGIVGNYWTAGLSGGDKEISQDQMAYILSNFARSKGYSYSTNVGMYHESARPCTREAFAWASTMGLFGDNVNPRGRINAGQASAVLRIFFEKVAH